MISNRENLGVVLALVGAFIVPKNLLTALFFIAWCTVLFLALLVRAMEEKCDGD